MTRFGIQKVFDFMAVDAYNNLVNWEMLRTETNADVLNATSSQLAGDALLFPLGVVTRRYLTMQEDVLIGKGPGDFEQVTEYGVEVEFTRGIAPKSRNVRREQEPPQAPATAMLTPEDLVVRMRLNLGLIVDTLSPLRGKDDYFPGRVEALRAVPSELRYSMRRINALRNVVLHDYYLIRSNEWQPIRDEYAKIEGWARKQPDLKKLPLRHIP